MGLTADIAVDAAARVMDLAEDGDSFTAYDVTLWLRDQMGRNTHVSHEIVKAAVHATMAAIGKDFGYNWKPQQFGDKTARLYYQAGAESIRCFARID